MRVRSGIAVAVIGVLGACGGGDDGPAPLALDTRHVNRGDRTVDRADAGSVGLDDDGNLISSTVIIDIGRQGPHARAAGG